MKVRFIRVNYQFSGTHNIMKMGTAGGGGSQGQIPRTIARCWD